MRPVRHSTLLYGFRQPFQYDQFWICSKVTYSKTPIVTERGAVMAIKHLFALLLVLIVSVGCNLMDRQQSPNVAETPPYWQPRSELAHSQLAEMRAFHEKETAKMSRDLRAANNREMERLEEAGKALERDKRWQEDYERTLERRERWTNWTSWFKNTDEDDKKGEAPVLSSRLGNTNQNVR